MRSMKILSILGLVSLFTMSLILGYNWYTKSYKETDLNKEINLLSNQLPIPPLLEDMNDQEGVGDYYLVAQYGKSQILPNMTTDTLGYNGDYLGPVIKLRRGEQVNMHVTNDLAEATSVHWHGLIVGGHEDGGPHQLIQAGATWEPSFVVNQPAATLWFHPHVIGTTASQVYYGLAGMIILEDDESDELNLPNAYGINDFPLILQDRSFNEEGNFDYVTTMMDGAIGDRVLINGALNPSLRIGPEKIRLRILNGANASNFTLKLTDKLSWYQIGSDGGLLEKPITMEEVFISPGERAEMVIDFSGFREGDQIDLISDDQSIMTFIIGGPPHAAADLPQDLVNIEPLVADYDVISQTVILDGMGHMVSINGKKYDMDRIDAISSVGSTDLWEVVNQSGMMHSMGHPFHIHGVQFQIVKRSLGGLADQEKGWKDTVYIRPNESVYLLVRFDLEGIYMYHCHILEHEEDGMMAQILVE